MAMSGDTLRLFIAVELPDEVKRALALEQQRLQARAEQALDLAVRQGLRWVAPEGIHLTLKFLGRTAAPQVPSLESAMQEAVAGARALTIFVGGLGVFPGASRPRVLWVGITGDLAPLSALQRRIDAATAALGFASEQRPFSPHLTLARVREEPGAADRRALGGLVEAERFDVRLEVPVREVSLMRSRLERSGAKYSRLVAVRLTT